MTLGGEKLVAIVEARMTSSRLPGKVLLRAGGRPLLQILVERLRRVERIDEIVIATTTRPTDDPVVALAERLGVGAFRGSEEDVLGRVSEALKHHRAVICVEVTGDCPLVDPAIVNEMLDAFSAAGCVYASNSDPHRAVPAGLDVQVFRATALYELDRESTDADEREHVTYAFYRPEGAGRWKPFFAKHPSATEGTEIWLSLDYQEDYELIKQLHEDLSAARADYGVAEMIAWVRDHPDLHDRCRRLRPGWPPP